MSRSSGQGQSKRNKNVSVCPVLALNFERLDRLERLVLVYQGHRIKVKVTED